MKPLNADALISASRQRGWTAENIFCSGCSRSELQKMLLRPRLASSSIPVLSTLLRISQDSGNLLFVFTFPSQLRVVAVDDSDHQRSYVTLEHAQNVHAQCDTNLHTHGCAAVSFRTWLWTRCSLSSCVSSFRVGTLLPLTYVAWLDRFLFFCVPD